MMKNAMASHFLGHTVDTVDTVAIWPTFSYHLAIWGQNPRKQKNIQLVQLRLLDFPTQPLCHVIPQRLRALVRDAGDQQVVPLCDIVLGVEHLNQSLGKPHDRCLVI